MLFLEVVCLQLWYFLCLTCFWGGWRLSAVFGRWLCVLNLDVQVLLYWDSLHRGCTEHHNFWRTNWTIQVSIMRGKLSVSCPMLGRCHGGEKEMIVLLLQVLAGLHITLWLMFLNSCQVILSSCGFCLATLERLIDPGALQLTLKVGAGSFKNSGHWRLRYCFAHFLKRVLLLGLHERHNFQMWLKLMVTRINNDCILSKHVAQKAELGRRSFRRTLFALHLDLPQELQLVHSDLMPDKTAFFFDQHSVKGWINQWSQAWWLSVAVSGKAVT